MSEGQVMADQKAILHTNHGDITITLFPNHAPETVANFVGLATGTKEYTDDAGRSGVPYYDGLGFHRVIPGFMIQGGCPLGTGTGGPGYTFKDEPHPELTFDKPYLLAMANAGPGTNGSQFFITTGQAPWLNFKHTIFGGRRRGVEEGRRLDLRHQDRCDGPPSRAGRHRDGRDRLVVRLDPGRGAGLLPPPRP
jgi:peptidyl-prolyl cis-trans isomerase A (cyclophilin A)